MPDDGERDVGCPRCGYNLRGLTTPRCPECAFEFTFEELRSGLLRENIPTWLDRCDPWQPHQVLVRSLYELIRGALHPRRLLTKLDVNGPLTPAWLMLIGGTLWLWLLTAAILAVGIVWHAGASPAIAIKTGVLVWGPVLVLPGLAFAGGLVSVAIVARIMCVARPSVAQRFRLGAYMLAPGGLWGCLPLAVVHCVIPEIAFHLRFGWLLLPFLWALAAGLANRRNVPTSRRSLVVVALVATVSVTAVVLVTKWLRPDTLEPPWWVYFF